MNERTKELAEQAHELAVRDCEVDLRANYSTVRDERFAELIRQDEREQISHTYLKLTLEAVIREREANAKLCEGLSGRSYEYDMGRLHSAAAIRARSNHETT